MNINRYTIAALCAASISLTGCQNIGLVMGDKTAVKQPVELGVTSITQQLVNNVHFNVAGKRIISSTFVWSDTLTTSTKNQDMGHLGALLQESISTNLTKAGANVMEIKSANAIYLTPTSELILSRVGEKIASKTMADYVLTGVMTPSEYGTVINAKLINLHNKQIVAAARQVIAPLDSTNTHQHSSTVKDGLLYRDDSTKRLNDE
jgi:TolB-like protein